MHICGRSGNCHGGHSVIEQSSYISREKMYCEYDGQTYYPKSVEDLVHTEVMLPANAPAEYIDPKILWNSVENSEKSSNAQLARTFRVELPNEWSYELATDVMRDYIKRNFTDKGMCVQFAIHDSENNKGQRNLHCHMLLTLRGIDENGKWLPKQKKEYITDENNNRIPLIDKKTGKQKVDSHNRKQWKCRTVSTNDWSSKENAKKWRIELTDTINSVNEKLGMTENYWEHRSFKEQGLDIVPQIHLGEKASALERAGIRSIRGDINREIIKNNINILNARKVYDEAINALNKAKEITVDVITNVKNELADIIEKVAKRNNNRLRLPIKKGKFLYKIANRDKLQEKDFMLAFIQSRKLETIEDVKRYKSEQAEIFNKLDPERTAKQERKEYLENLLEYYHKKYEPYIKFHKEQWSLKGKVRKQYEDSHRTQLYYYDVYRDLLKEKIKEEDKKISPSSWQKELDIINAELDKTTDSFNQSIINQAIIEVLEYNKEELDRMLENEKHTKSKNRNINIDDD